MFTPVPEACSGITPTVDVAVPTPVAAPIDIEFEEEPLLEVEELTIAELVGTDRTAPVELKLKV